MKPVYCDSSVLVSILFQEAKHERYARHLKNAKVVSGALLEAEVFSVLRREGHPLDSADEMLASVALLFPDRSLTEEYAQVFKAGYCRGADAYHLACALYLDPERKFLSFLTADKAQETIARKLGLLSPT